MKLPKSRSSSSDHRGGLAPSLAAVLFLGLALAACQPRELNQVIVRGVIENAQVGQARMANHTAEIGPTGRFVLQFEPAGRAYRLLEVGERIPLYLGPGDQVEVYANADSLFETLQLRGANAHINRYLVEASLAAQEIDWGALLALPQDAFIERTLELQAASEARLDAFLESHTAIPHEFANDDRESLRYAWARIRQQHPGFDGHLAVAEDSVFVDRFDVELHPALRSGLEQLTRPPASQH